MAVSQPKIVEAADHGKGFRVSSRSFWTDEVWHLDNSKPGQVNTIGWRFLLPDGSWSTDPQNFELLESLRETIWGMLIDGGWYGRTLTVGSLERLAYGGRTLLRWMNYRGLGSMADLTPANQLLYREDLPGIIAFGSDFYGDRLRDAEFEPEDFDSDFEDRCDLPEAEPMEPEGNKDDAQNGEEEKSESDELTWTKVSLRLNIIYAVYAQGPRLKARGFGVIEREPFYGEPLYKIARTVVKYALNRIPPLPDEVVGPLLSAAIEWIDVRSIDVLAMQEIMLAERIVRPNGGNSADARAKRIREALVNYTFKDGSDIFKPWNIENFGGGISRNPADVLRFSVNRLRDACVIVLQYLVGIRPSEVCGIPGGLDAHTGLPSCVGMVRLRAGFIEAFYLRSVLSKGVDRPREEEWLLSCRPAGSTHVPLTARAVCVLERLMSPWRSLVALSR